MPTKEAKNRARRDKAAGKSPSTQAGEFVAEEIENIRRGEHGARSAKQAIAIGLSEARRAGVALPPPKKGATSKKTRRAAQRDIARGQSPASHKLSAKRSQAALKALRREPRAAASHRALSRQARIAAAARGSAARSATAAKAARTRASRA